MANNADAAKMAGATNAVNMVYTVKIKKIFLNISFKTKVNFGNVGGTNAANMP